MNAQQNYNILIVEDEVGIFEILRDIIFKVYPDAKVTHATNGMRAIELLRSDIFHVILSDYFMSELNGLELLILLRAANVLCPFVLITGSVDPLVIRTAWQNGASAMLEKPFGQEAVKTVIAEAIKSSKFNSIRAYGSVIDEKLTPVELYLPERILNLVIVKCEREGVSLSDYIVALLKKTG